MSVALHIMPSGALQPDAPLLPRAKSSSDSIIEPHIPRRFRYSFMTWQPGTCTGHICSRIDGSNLSNVSFISSVSLRCLQIKDELSSASRSVNDAAWWWALSTTAESLCERVYDKTRTNTPQSTRINLSRSSLPSGIWWMITCEPRKSRIESFDRCSRTWLGFGFTVPSTLRSLVSNESSSGKVQWEFAKEVQHWNVIKSE